MNALDKRKSDTRTAKKRYGKSQMCSFFDSAEIFNVYMIINPWKFEN